MSTTDADKIAVLASRLARAHSRRQAAEEEIAEIKAEIGEAMTLAEGAIIATADGVRVACVRRTGRRFDPIKAASVLPDAVIPQISTMQIDPKVAKVKLPKDVYDQCLSTGNLSIVMK